MVSVEAEILPSLGLGGLLLGQSLKPLPWQEKWQETGPIVRGTVADGTIEIVGDSETDRIIGLAALPGYRGQLPGPITLGMTMGEALQRMPQLRVHDLDSSLYEPERLGFLLRPQEDADRDWMQAPIGSISIWDWGHDYWAFARPLLLEEDCEES